MKKITLNQNGYEQVVYYNAIAFETLLPAIVEEQAQDLLMRQLVSCFIQRLGADHLIDQDNRYYLMGVKKNLAQANRYQIVIFDERFCKIESKQDIDIEPGEPPQAQTTVIHERAITAEETQLFEQATRFGAPYLNELTSSLENEFQQGKLTVTPEATMPSLQLTATEHHYQDDRAETLFHFEWSSLNSTILSRVLAYKSKLTYTLNNQIEELKKEAEKILIETQLASDDYDVKELAEFAQALVNDLQLPALEKNIADYLSDECKRLDSEASTIAKKQVEVYFFQHETRAYLLRYLKKLLAWCVYESARHYLNDIIKWEASTINEKRESFNKKFACVRLQLAKNSTLSSVEEMYCLFDSLRLPELQALLRTLLTQCETTAFQVAGLRIPNPAVGGYKLPTVASTLQKKLHEGFTKFNLLCQTLIENNNAPYYLSTGKNDFTWGEGAWLLEEKISAICAPLLNDFSTIATDDKDQELTSPFLRKLFDTLLKRSPQLEFLEEKLREQVIRMHGQSPRLGQPRKRLPTRVVVLDGSKREGTIHSAVKAPEEKEFASIKLQIQRYKIILRFKRLKEQTHKMIEEATRNVILIHDNAKQLGHFYAAQPEQLLQQSANHSAMKMTTQFLAQKSGLIHHDVLTMRDELQRHHQRIAAFSEKDDALNDKLAIEHSTLYHMDFWRKLIIMQNKRVAFYHQIVMLIHCIFYDAKTSDVLTNIKTKAAEAVARIHLDHSELAMRIANTLAYFEVTVKQLEAALDDSMTQFKRVNDKPYSPMKSTTSRDELERHSDLGYREVMELEQTTTYLDAALKTTLNLRASAQKSLALLIDDVAFYQNRQLRSPAVQACQKLVALIQHQAFWGNDIVRVWGAETHQPGVKVPEGIRQMLRVIEQSPCPLDKLDEASAQALMLALKETAQQRINYATHSPRWLLYSLFRLRKEPTRTFYEAVMNDHVDQWINQHPTSRPAL